MSIENKIVFNVIGSDNSFYDVELFLKDGVAGAVDVNIQYKKATASTWKFLIGETIVDEKQSVEDLRFQFNRVLGILTNKLRDFFGLSGSDDLPPTAELRDRLAALLLITEWDPNAKRLVFSE